MLKSILLVCAAFALLSTPFARAARVPRQAAQTPAASPAPTTSTTPAPSEAPATAAPGMAANMKNPVVKPTPDQEAKARQLYSIDCAMCHGDNGNGKTDLATSMNLTLLDFTNPKSLADHLDGELFNVIRNGKDKMPGEDKARATDTEVWTLVLYVRNFSKTQATATAAK